MKNLLLISLLMMNILSAQSNLNIFRTYDQSASPIQINQFRYSLLENIEYGIGNNLIVMAHPVMLFLSPSISVKYNFYQKGNLIISTIHGVNYPTILMNLVKSEGTGGFISPEFSIPQMISIKNSIIVSYILNNSNLLTGEFGVEFAINNSKLNPGTSVDLPIILPRSMVYYKNLGINFKLISEGQLIQSFDYHFKSELFLFPIRSNSYDHEYQLTKNNIFWELSGNVFLNTSPTFKIGVGTKLSYGTYPFGKQWHLLPFIDFVKYCL